MKKKIEFFEKCKSCGGTGLYVGFGEANGAAVVCECCEGTGKFHFIHEYEEFETRVERKEIKRVFETNPGIGIGSNDKDIFLEDFGGMPYEEWKKTGKFPPKSEMRMYVCPAWWYQGVDYDKIPQWDECISCGTFSNCKMFKNKQKCWEKFDSEK